MVQKSAEQSAQVMLHKVSQWAHLPQSQRKTRAPASGSGHAPQRGSGRRSAKVVHLPERDESGSNSPFRTLAKSFASSSNGAANESREYTSTDRSFGGAWPPSGAPIVSMQACFRCHAQEGRFTRVATYIPQLIGVDAELEQERSQPLSGLAWLSAAEPE